LTVSWVRVSASFVIVLHHKIERISSCGMVSILVIAVPMAVVHIPALAIFL